MSVSELVHDPAAPPIVMGIVNVTPDSFSDGGKFINENKAIEHGVKLLEEGAQILDIGGESTRPGSQRVEIQEEIDRILPVIEGLKKYGACLSVDTRNAATMRAALDAGASIINDISALEYDSESIFLAVGRQVPVILMHMQGSPDTMQENPSYNNVIEDIYVYLQKRIRACETAGIERKNVIIDPGIGFGKTLEHNLLIHRNISKFFDLGCNILFGSSRKRFIADLSKGESANERLAGSLSSVIWARSQGVNMFRVHDVKETVQALKVYDSISAVSALR
ncbi:MAG: dihydropteroate synthase [Micavibrio sp.]|nr:dihydropteroate synthase [Micavibrio sp.]|tara:strand:- start:211 stop:1050 length:840 start_codon:yes stop_codon:yes gene_type:complete